MLGALVAVLSLNLTLLLVQKGQVAGTLPITGATATTPVTVTSTAHGVPLGRVVHGVVSGVTGTTEANGLWVLTPTDANTFALSTFNAAGTLEQSIGSNAYVSGGTISYAFPDYQILLGRRNLALNTAVATPRIVMVPAAEGPWGYDPYGGDPRNATENLAGIAQPQEETEPTTFEVYVTGAANPPSPDFGDFDATQAIVWALRSVMRQGVGLPRCPVLSGGWPSQLPAGHPLATGVQSQRGQQWMGTVRFEQPVVNDPFQFVPAGTTFTFDVGTVPGGSADDTVIVVT